MNKIKIPKGLKYLKIGGFSGSWGSGLGFLNGTDENGYPQIIPYDNSCTVRALEDAFGNVITNGHTANGKGIKEKEIYYSTDFVGVLEWFSPVEYGKN